MEPNPAEVLICFDVDGTLETSAGPVPISRLVALNQFGYRVAIVSPSGHAPPGFPKFVPGTRQQNLEDAARQHRHAVLRLYVSDNQDRDAARAAGFTYIEARDFV